MFVNALVNVVNTLVNVVSTLVNVVNTLINVVSTLVNVCHLSVLNRESARTLTSSKLDAVQYLELIDYQTDTQTILPHLQTR